MNKVIESLLIDLCLELTNSYSNDWTNEEKLKGYIKGLEYAINKIHIIKENEK